MKKIKSFIPSILIAFSGYTQNHEDVRITPTTEVELDSNTSYVYCASMDIMWDNFSDYLGELPQSTFNNSMIKLLNETISKNYQKPIEDKYVVSHTGFIGDSIIKTINNDLSRKFNTSWSPPPNLSDDALVAYSYLKKDVKFLRFLDDNFYKEPFDKGVSVDYFGVKEGNPQRKRRDILVHDYKNPKDFIIEIKCKDSLDEVFLARIPKGKTMQETFENVLERVDLENWEKFDGGDVLKIPYIKFDTTKEYEALEGTSLENSKVKGKSFQSVTQKINFDLNHQGIKLESSAETIVDFADFDNPPPRVLAFDEPFLIIMKRKNSENPYFMYWVSGVEFMRSYILKSRNIGDHETILVGKWYYSQKNIASGEIIDCTDEKEYIEFYKDGTFAVFGDDLFRPTGSKGEWEYLEDSKTIELLYLSAITRDFKIKWKLDEVSSEQFIIGGKTKLIYEKMNTDNNK